MHAHSPRRGVRRLALVLSVVALLAVCASSTGTAAAGATRPLQLSGTWSGKYSGAFSGKFTLHWHKSGGRLSGTIALSNPSGTYGISGSVHGAAIKFGAVDVGATYTGTVSGKSMSGTYKSPHGGGTWSARKTA